MHSEPASAPTKRHDFTLDGYRDLLATFVTNGYGFVRIENAEALASRKVLLRHDIDIDLDAAVTMATLERSLGITATYFVALESPFYNAFSANGRAALKAITDAGHTLGLHLDLLSEVPRPDAQELDRRLLSVGTLLPELDVTAVSLHSPPSLEAIPRNLWRQVDKVYGAVLMHGASYLSDSTGRWRSGHPCDSHAFQNGAGMHLLIHPEWWTYDGRTPWHKIERCLAANLGSDMGHARAFFPKLARIADEID